MTARQQFSTFYLDDLLFGIAVEKIQEVLNYQEITPVPLAPSLVAGLINLRGQIITAVDFRQRLGFSKRSADYSSINIVVRNNEDVVSLLVDKIGDVVEVGEETFEPPPEMLDPKCRALILGVHKLSGKLMHVLDADQAVALSS